MTMSARAPLLSRFLAAHLVLFGAAAVDLASAQDHAQVANKADAEANPIDISITTQRPSHFRRGLKAHDSKRSTIARKSGNSGYRRTLIRGTKVGVVRNAIGQHVHHTSIDAKGAEVKASERIAVDGALKNASPAGNGGTEAGGIDSHGQGFVPLRAGWAAPRDPRTQHGDEPFDHQRSRYGPSGSGVRRARRSGEESCGCHQRNQLPAPASVMQSCDCRCYGMAMSKPTLMPSDCSWPLLKE